uniref:Uncharacterized protein n=1 Tax=Arundo donax TaxID=35708 RepID=A0A0A8ZZV6_ARUDO
MSPKPPCTMNCLKLSVNFFNSLYVNCQFSISCR